MRTEAEKTQVIYRILKAIKEEKTVLVAWDLYGGRVWNITEMQSNIGLSILADLSESDYFGVMEDGHFYVGKSTEFDKEKEVHVFVYDDATDMRRCCTYQVQIQD